MNCYSFVFIRLSFGNKCLQSQCCYEYSFGNHLHFFFLTCCDIVSACLCVYVMFTVDLSFFYLFFFLSCLFAWLLISLSFIHTYMYIMCMPCPKTPHLSPPSPPSPPARKKVSRFFFWADKLFWSNITNLPCFTCSYHRFTLPPLVHVLLSHCLVTEISYYQDVPKHCCKLKTDIKYKYNFKNVSVMPHLKCSRISSEKKHQLQNTA